ncbi:FtsX-like permease family protein [Hydrogenoanaerobacterium sp.]|uniref:FtsX-like permease family protein n=1 Tax=Hydrogenoanaerobacterium sp. TaxID=2953763 RepID=UPI00289C1CFB|nr:FtsX-like permease family protein [Hydrogenoanaerobacterium sp.]
MKKAMLKDTFRELWRTKNRFFSIFAIIAIGVGFFAGLKATCPDMKHTADVYFSEGNLFDVHLLSTIGFNDKDVETVRGTEGVGAVMPAYTTDALVNTNGSNAVVKVHGIPIEPDSNDPAYMNRPTVLEGRLPEKSGECVVDLNNVSAAQFELGQQITLFFDAKQDSISETLRTDTYTIVGFVRTPYYITYERGNSNIGNGKIERFVMIPNEDFNLEVYTNLYVTAESKDGISSFSPQYDELVASLQTKLEALGDVRVQTRYDEILQEANEKLADARQELAEGEETQRTELADAHQKIEDAKKKLADGIQTLTEKERDYYKQIAEAETELEEARQKIADATEEYRDGYETYKKEKSKALKELAAAEQQLEQLHSAIPQILSLKQSYDLLGDATLAADTASPQELMAYAEAIRPLSGELANLLLAIANTPVENPMRAQYIAAFKGGVQAAQKQMEEQLSAMTGGQISLPDVTAESLNQKIASAEDLIAFGYEELDEAKKTLEDAKKQLDDGRQELADAELEFKDGKAEGLQKINDAKAEIADAKVQIADAETKYADGKRDSDRELADARVEIADAEADLAEFSLPEWFVQDRDDLPGYADYDDAAERIAAISKVFPVFFLLVAGLVCLTTMTRMIEEQRTQIGTIKALGYSNLSIVSKYLIYALTASFTGSAAGLMVGFQLFPRVIYDAYGMMYILPPLIAPFKWDYAIVATAAAVLVTVSTVVFASYKELVSVPATLMRPKAPKNGKRVLLERLPFVWNHMNFTQKVTIRNLLRYKKRMLMTVIGIAGCTALMLTGFGVKDSISNIVTKQFGDIFKYDVLAVLDSDLSKAEKDSVMQLVSSSEYSKNNTLVYQKSYDILLGDKQANGNLFVPESPDNTADFVVFRDRISGSPIPLTDQGVIVSEKTATLLGAKMGDTLTLRDSDNKSVTVPLAGITENYAGHYAYISPALYESLYGSAPDYNTLLSVMNDSDKANRDAFSHFLLGSDDILLTSFTADTRATFNDVFKSLDYVVLVLILSAGSLAFVVLYNLTNINITERIREIATIKVLGFFDKEVSAYVFRENILLTLMGMVAGLFGGVLLHRFVIVTAEVNMMMFGRNIQPLSFVLAGAITMLFAFIVNGAMYYKLKKVSMVESLKSVE